MRSRLLSSSALLAVLSFAAQLCGATGNGVGNTAPTSISKVDVHALPTDVFTHFRSKWSGDRFILINDDAGAPSLYVFDRSGQRQFDAMIQIAGANKVRVEDFAAAPDGSVWACGHADSSSGQRGFFLAHMTDDGQVQNIRTNPYRAWYLTVAPDSTLWTVGYGLGANGRVDLSQNSLRHFDESGKLIGSAIPASSVGLLRVETGYLEFGQGVLGWYSSTSGSRADHSIPDDAYVEISPSSMAVLHSYPAAPRNWNDYVMGFALTPSGRVFVKVYQHSALTRTSQLYELDRSGNRWTKVQNPVNQQGYVPGLEGNQGESLVFRSALANQSEIDLQMLDLGQASAR